MKHPILLLATLALLSCSKKEQTVSPSVPEEALTTVILTATPQGGGASVFAKWNQKVGADGNPIGDPDTSQATLELKDSTVYVGQITMIDSTQTPPFLVSGEVLERGTYHLFFYQPTPTKLPLIIPGTPNDTGSAPLNLVVLETDHYSSAHQYPIGLQTNLLTGAPSSGRLRVVLRHQPNVKDGTYTPGESDADVTFGVRIIR